MTGSRFTRPDGSARIRRRHCVPAAIALTLTLCGATVLAVPTVFPTGTTIYKPDKCYNGYNLVGMSWWGGDTYLADMNGNRVKVWDGLVGHSAFVLPGGHVMGQSGTPKQTTARQVDWDGNVVWSFEGAHMSHDMAREGFPAGYYSPEADPKVVGGRTLLNVQYPGPKGEQERPDMVRDHLVQDQYLLEVDWAGNVLWEWSLNQHFDALGISQAGRFSLRHNPSTRFIDLGVTNSIDWAHVNAATWLGLNRWYDAGDERFHPENVIWSSRTTSIIGITSRKTGEIVWQIGPDYGASPALEGLGPILGSHGVHMIPKGLPGAGNILVFDNGGASVYGAPNQASPDGRDTIRRHYSRVVEFDPVTLEPVWVYSAQAAGHSTRRNPHQFFSPFQSNAQRLPNGNTFVLEAVYGRLFELTPDFEIVWEYIEPYWRQSGDTNLPVFRAYRVPFEYVPQLEPPTPVAVTPPPMRDFRLEARGAEAARPVVTQ